jgi:hypothetical protein
MAYRERKSTYGAGGHWLRSPICSPIQASKSVTKYGVTPGNTPACMQGCPPLSAILVTGKPYSDTNLLARVLSGWSPDWRAVAQMA